MVVRRQFPSPRHGVARVLSKRGFCSRSQAEALVRDGRVALRGRRVLDPEAPAAADDAIAVDGREVAAVATVHVMLNKPRGLVTTRTDDQGRDTVYRCFEGAGLPWLAPVGRLDRASEGLLLFSNDPVWAAGITDPAAALSKTYHVQIDRTADEAELLRLRAGVHEDGELLSAQAVRILRRGEKRSWLEVVLDEGRNRQIRRMLAACGIGVVRLVRVAIGPLQLGEIGKGAWRHLEAHELDALRMTRQAGGGRR